MVCLNRIRCVIALAFLVGLLPSAPLRAQGAWKPDRTVELVVFAAAGGGNDKAARMLNKLWTESRFLGACRA
jgi:tripartite-type tricarboxylate transporter receptor subunit TctC